MPHTTPDYDFEAAATFINSSIQWILASYSILSPPPSVSLLVHDDEQHYKSEGKSGGKNNGRDRFDCGGAAATAHLRTNTTLLYRQTDAGQQVAIHSKKKLSRQHV